jgi:integrase/recombinase XerD
MTGKPTSCGLTVAAAKLSLKSYIRRYDRCKSDTQASYLYTILAFLESLQRDHPHPPGMIVMSEPRLMEWLASVCGAGSFGTAVHKVHLVGHFMRHLMDTGVIQSNPMADIRLRYGKQGWAGIVRALQSRDVTGALAKMRTEPTYHGSFGKHARSYIELHRAAGKKYRVNEADLINFNRFLRQRGDDSIQSITSAVVQEWIGLRGSSPGSRRQRLHILRQFFRYACDLKVVRANPVTKKMLDEIGAPRHMFRPNLFTAEQVRVMLQKACGLARTNMFPLRPEVMYTIIGLLYTLGLRISEAVNLRFGDIDADRGTLFIRQTKFFKERYVPYGPRFAAILGRYIKARHAVTPSPRKEDPVFIGWAGRPVTAHLIRRHFKEVMKAAGVTPTSGSALPRVHDLRHTFAVDRLLRWYRDGVDVQERLVLLSTFMGHVSIYSTQRYLSITGALLDEANKRFRAMFGDVAGEEQP